MHAHSGITVVWIHPRPSHFLQPLDLSVFLTRNGRARRAGGESNDGLADSVISRLARKNEHTLGNQHSIGLCLRH
jgi:hypothetical protein